MADGSPLSVWDYLWDCLARWGHCGDRGGAEYTRVTAAWVAEGRPVDMRGYIVDACRRPA